MLPCAESVCMPRLFFEVPTQLRWVMAALALLPCAPGLTFLLAGWVRDPGRAAPDEVPTEEYQRAVQQTRGLYKVGSVALIAGMLIGTVVVWNVIRHRDDDDDQEESAR